MPRTEAGDGVQYVAEMTAATYRLTHRILSTELSTDNGVNCETTLSRFHRQSVDLKYFVSR